MKAIGLGIPELLVIAWFVVFYVQIFMSYGTAYRLTKKNGDNGVSLFGWMLLYSFISMVPGLGIYLWVKSKDDKEPKVETKKTNTIEGGNGDSNLG